MHHNITSDDGALRIFVRVEVSIDDQNRERVRVTRVPEGWASWPSEVLILEGETETITIYPLGSPLS